MFLPLWKSGTLDTIRIWLKVELDDSTILFQTYKKPTVLQKTQVLVDILYIDNLQVYRAHVHVVATNILMEEVGQTT